MLFQQLNRSDSEKVYVTAYNVEGATITTGLPVAYQTGASCDGVNVVVANAAADYPGFIGVAKADIPANQYGLVQVGGFVNSILLSNTGTSITINAGDALIPAPAGFYSAAPTYANSGFKWLQASNVPSTLVNATYASGLLKLI